MRQLYIEYSDIEISEQDTLKSFLGQAVPKIDLILGQAVPELKTAKNQTITEKNILLESIKKIVCTIPWGHNILIMQKCKTLKERLFYISSSIKMAWTRDTLLNQIKMQAYERSTTNKLHNFKNTTPLDFSDQASKSLKSIYNLEFLNIKKPVYERELENKLVRNIKQFLLELGYGFCFIGQQYRLVLDAKEYFIDLLFYHRFLKSLVAIELKTVEFEPEHAGKMDFYLNLLNHYEKAPDDNPAIGIILCADHNKLEVEFSLKTKQNPIGVAEYQLVKALPKEFKGKLPTNKELTEIITQKIKE